MSTPNIDFTYQVVLLDHSADSYTPGRDSFGRYDITNRCNVVEFDDDFPISATITLDCRDGRYLTTGPIIKRWDRIYLKCTDKFGNICFEEVVHVKKRKRSRKKGIGLQLVLVCPHQSSNLLSQKIYMPARRDSGFDALNEATAQLLENLGSNDPTPIIFAPFEVADKLGNSLSESTTNDYIYEGVPYQEVVNDILKREGDVVSSGGAFQFNYFRFVSLYDYTTNSEVNSVALQVFPQGYKNNGGVLTNIPTVTLVKNPVGQAPSNYVSTDGDDDTEQATNIIAIGAKNAGSYPKQYSQFQGQLDTFNSAQAWQTGVVYLVGQRVQVNNNFYQCILQHTSNSGNKPPNATYWQGPQVFSPTVDYSPLTNNKAQYWINAAGGWINAGTENAEVAIVDPNIIIQDALHNRTWCDTVGTNPASIDSNLLVGGNTPFDGLRVLCNGTGTGLFSGNDPTGTPYSNNLVEFRNYFGIVEGWYVFRVSQQDDEIYSFREGVSWTFKPCTGLGSFVDGSGVCNIGSRGSSWVQGAYTLINIPGVGVLGSFTANGQFDCVHPVKHDASANVEIGNEKISPNDTSGKSAVFINFAPTQGPRNFFAGANFAFPWPRNSNPVPYGAVTIGEQILLCVFDLLNMYKTHRGQIQNFGPDVEDYYPINGFSFFELLQDFLGANIFNPTGNYAMGLWLADRNDTVVVIEYTHVHNDVTEPESPALGSLKIYRGIPGISDWLPAQQIEVTNIFDPRSVIRGGVYTKDSFDQNGRYLAAGNNVIIPGYSSSSRFHATQKLHLSLDGFIMVKPLVSTNLQSLSSLPQRNISTTNIKADTIVSKAQLDNVAASSARIYNFQPQQHQIMTQGRGDIQAGDPVYYTDSEIIPDTTNSLANTLLMVASSVTYTISKTPQGPGGLTRLVKLITRVWPSP